MFFILSISLVLYNTVCFQKWSLCYTCISSVVKIWTKLCASEFCLIHSLVCYMFMLYSTFLWRFVFFNHALLWTQITSLIELYANEFEKRHGECMSSKFNVNPFVPLASFIENWLKILLLFWVFFVDLKLKLENILKEIRIRDYI